MASYTFSSLTTAELTSMKTAILTFFTTRVESGLQKYTLEGRSVARMNPKELAEILDAVSNELARRSLATDDPLGIALTEFGDG